MAEYFEKEAVLQNLEAQMAASKNPSMMIERIRNLQTVEAEPVKHGRWLNWKPKYIGMEYSHDIKECSKCGHTMSNALIIPAYYCPNCGASMDLGKTAEGEKNMTNADKIRRRADKIRSMTDEEIVELMWHLFRESTLTSCKYENWCKKKMTEWLQQPASEI